MSTTQRGARNAECGVWTAAIFLAAFSASAGAEPLPDLQLPHGELPPTFWEQYRWLIILAAAFALVLVTLLVVILRRPRPVVITPPDLLARRALEVLRDSVEDGALLMQVSAILRRYVVFACGIPPRELTTTEVCDALASQPRFSPDLSLEVGDFLRRCDERKFAPRPPPPTGSVVDTALDLVRKLDQRRHEPRQILPPPIPESALVSGVKP